MHSIITVLKHPRYMFLASGTALALFTTIALLPNITLVGQIIISDDISFRDTVSVIIGIMGGIATSQGIVATIFAALSSVLFGVNAALIVHLYRRGVIRVAGGGAAASFAGTSVSVLGAGCAACGVFAFPAFASFIGASGLSFLLPFFGAGFGFVGVMALLVSIAVLARRIDHGTVCAVSS